MVGHIGYSFSFVKKIVGQTQYRLLCLPTLTCHPFKQPILLGHL